ncbi:hypothetical protein [Actinophytocola sp.]|uniref:hypothetical protein n=1 Tax=Actinophytocola sp. TaxID=1872138 RepID=UPI003D6A6FF5
MPTPDEPLAEVETAKRFDRVVADRDLSGRRTSATPGGRPAARTPTILSALTYPTPRWVLEPLTAPRGSPVSAFLGPPRITFPADTRRWWSASGRQGAR